MAADMLKARNAIKVLREVGYLGEMDHQHVEAIADLCDTFEWLDESRGAVIMERDDLLARIAELTNEVAALDRDLDQLK
jgi:uncharacterized protein YceH (UPF0502 family)